MLDIDKWYLIRKKKGMRQYKHAYREGLVTIAGSPGDELARGALNSIVKQAGLKNEISGSD
jgi:predicted RNA binding protein YcfA (HicA-like mRNA interferase family)